ncbi:MAG: tetratricopeptide repeat protein [Bacteroidota bacterium]
MPRIHIQTFIAFLLGCTLLSVAQENDIDKDLQNLRGEEYFQKVNEITETLLEGPIRQANLLVGKILADTSLANYPMEQAKALLLKGKISSALGEYEEAYTPLDQAIVLFQELEVEDGLAECYLTKGVSYSYQGQKDQAKLALDKSLALYTGLDEEYGIGRSLYELGHFNYIFGEDEKALEYYQKALDIQEDLDDQKGISDNYFRMGLAYLSTDRGKALELLDSSKELKEEIADHRGLAKVNNSLGVLNEENKNFQAALEYYRQSLEANKKFEDKRVASIIYNNLGIVFLDLKKPDSAVVYHNKALELRKGMGNIRGVVQSLVNIGEVYQTKKDFQSGLDYFHRARALSNSKNELPLMPYIQEKIGETHLSLEALDSANVYLNRALVLKQEEGNYNTMGSTYQSLSLLAEKRNEFKKSLAYYKNFKAVQDCVIINSKNRELAELQIKYDTAKQEQEISSLQQENKSRRLWQNIYALGALLALIVAGFVFQFFRFRSKKNQELLLAKESQRQQLEEVNQLKTRFFHNISHEFRTPLTLILGPLEQLKKTLDDSTRPTVDMIERNGKRLLKLINQLLDLSKIEDGKIGLKASYGNIAPLLKGWVTSFHSMAEIKGVDLSLNLEEPSYFVYADQEKLEEVVINLLSNAIKYTPSGGQVAVNIAADGKNLNIAVSDTGSGIPKEELEHIFDRFYQASNANSDQAVGTGIGLALVRELVEFHKGTVTVESTMGEGSNFKVSLPLGKSHLNEDEIVAIAPSPKISNVQTLEKDLDPAIDAIENEDTGLPLLLLIEDNSDLRSYIRSVLGHQYQIEEAVDGEQGIALALESTPDIIISDLMMPKKDGLEVCNTLKSDVRTSHIPIILLTARSSKEDKLEGLKSRADDYLTKPFNNEELLIRIENLVAIRKKIHQHFSTGDILRPKKLTLNSIDQEFMKQVTDILETEIANEHFGVEELSHAVALSRSQLFRKVKAITNQTPIEFIRSFRLHRAMDMLQQKSGTVAEIAYSVGFQNPSYFSKCFQEQFGQLPSAVSQNP